MNMNATRGAVVLALLASVLLAGCASGGDVRQAPAAAPDAGAPTPVPVPAAAATPEPPAVSHDESRDAPVIDSEPTTAELDFEAIYGTPADAGGPAGSNPQDPWERYNRRVHSFNNVLDQKLARPLAQAYVAVVPDPLRTGVRNFFNNLRQPVSALNALLQGKPKEAGKSVGRFVLNTTLGVGGLFDPATDAGLPYSSEDFGQTLGIWGWKNSRYVELPFFGPRTVRDAVGLAGDAPLSPVRQINDDTTRIGIQGLQLLSLREQLMAIDSLREGAADDYALIRDAWMQRRQYQIFGDRGDDSDLPDYLLEEEPPTIPADSIPPDYF